MHRRLGASASAWTPCLLGTGSWPPAPLPLPSGHVASLAVGCLVCMWEGRLVPRRVYNYLASILMLEGLILY